MAEILGGTQRELASVVFIPTLKPERLAANEMYRRLGFERGTNVYRIGVKEKH